ncbi:YhcN/YlaJ family sporulation lipoprotein [Paenibacillus thiaminolyticus]|uniref:YhcN/YlaJ family sporulation lipoprotein n=1 Tax=Paenibacillus thiaminolyticus TaxID=49283 RepID=UPI002543D3BD|nr:YhcN/YlaJ family sporulation lipoprotein [Paenibacillus thiaminolyticus]WII38878.1 YhcN/YlaJ family sporulation lipoprotein [Paenibacillus thiaminolyticus]
MLKKMVLLTLAAAMVMSMGLTGCATNTDNVTTRGAKNNMRTRTAQDGIYPLGMNPNLDTNANKYHGNRYGTRGYGVDGVRGYGVDGTRGMGLGTRGWGTDGTGTRGYGVDGTRGMGLGTRGWGTDGTGTRGYGVDGTRGMGLGTRGWGTDGTGTRGYGVDGIRGLGRGLGMDGVGTRGYGLDGMRGYGVDGAGTRGYGVDGLTHGYGTHGYGTHGYGTHGYGTHNYGITGYGVDSSRLHGYGTGTHSMTNMHMNKKIADKIARMKGVKSANVMLTNNNAYVAVSTDGHMKTKGTAKGTHHLKTKATHHRGTGAKSLSSKGGTGNLNARSKTHAHNIGTTGDVSEDLKKRIAEIVKKDAPQCNQVYVSANPDFVQQMNQFMKSSAAGHPLTGFSSQFQDMVHRIFPTQEAGKTTHMNVSHPKRMHKMAPGVR